MHPDPSRLRILVRPERPRYNSAFAKGSPTFRMAEREQVAYFEIRTSRPAAVPPAPATTLPCPWAMAPEPCTSAW